MMHVNALKFSMLFQRMIADKNSNPIRFGLVELDMR